MLFKFLENLWVIFWKKSWLRLVKEMIGRYNEYKYKYSFTMFTWIILIEIDLVTLPLFIFFRFHFDYFKYN